MMNTAELLISCSVSHATIVIDSPNLRACYIRLDIDDGKQYLTDGQRRINFRSTRSALEQLKELIGNDLTNQVAFDFSGRKTIAQVSHLSTNLAKEDI